MNTDPKPTLPDLFPLPEGIQLRTRRFGANPVSSPVPAPVGGNRGDSDAPRPEFKLHWEDPQQGLTVIVRERDNGHLIADVFAIDPGLLDKGAISVGLVGTVEGGLIRKTIPLGVPEKDGCSGSADFGPLASAVAELGSPLRAIVYLLV
jgi:hypothetical protein